MEKEPATPASADKDISATFAKGLAVIRAFDAEDRELSLAAVARKTGLNRAVARRLVLTLHRLGYLSENDRRYALTPRILSLGHGFLQGRRIGAAIQPILMEASQRIGAAVSLAMRDGTEAVYVAYAPADPRLITQGFTVGTRLPLGATAIGRTLLACADESEREALLEALPLERHTEKTCCDRRQLARRLDAVRADGFAYVDGEFEAGVASLAVPVTGSGGGPAGAIGMAVPSPRLARAADRQAMLAGLKDATAALAAVL